MKDYKNKKVFTRLVKPFAHVCCMLCSLSHNARRSQTKFRSIAAHSYGFTLAETLIVLLVLGIVASITIPNVIRRYHEYQGRTKIKKSMSITDYFIQKVVLENGFKSESALRQWANDDGQCTNSRRAFKIAKGDGCEFKTTDGILWNITNILRPLLFLSDEDKDKYDKTGETDGIGSFEFVVSYDPKTGSFRINDINYETSLAENQRDEEKIAALEKLYGYLMKKKPSVEENNEQAEICDEMCQYQKGNYNETCQSMSYSKCSRCYGTINPTTGAPVRKQCQVYGENEGVMIADVNEYYRKNGNDVITWKKDEITYIGGEKKQKITNYIPATGALNTTEEYTFVNDEKTSKILTEYDSYSQEEPKPIRTITEYRYANIPNPYGTSSTELKTKTKTYNGSTYDETFYKSDGSSVAGRKISCDINTHQCEDCDKSAIGEPGCPAQ